MYKRINNIPGEIGALLKRHALYKIVTGMIFENPHNGFEVEVTKKRRKRFVEGTDFRVFRRPQSTK